MSSAALIIDPWVQQQIFGILGILCFMIWYFRFNVDPALLIGFALFSISTLFMGDAISLFQLVMFFIFYALCPHKFVKPIMYGFVALMLCDALWFYNNHMYGFFNASTYDSSIMACLVPWVLFSDLKFKKYTYPAMAFMIFAIFGMHSRTGMVCLASTLFLWTIYRRHLKTFSVLLVAAFGAILWKGDVFFSSNKWGRLDMWDTYFTTWWSHVNHWIGTGFGSFQSYTFQMPIGEGAGIQYYRSMHNDYLQILFETGYLGLAVFVILTGYVFWKARKSLLEFSALAAYFVTCQFYFPLHYFFSQFLLVVTLVEIFKNERVCPQKI